MIDIACDISSDRVSVSPSLNLVLSAGASKGRLMYLHDLDDFLIVAFILFFLTWFFILDQFSFVQINVHSIQFNFVDKAVMVSRSSAVQVLLCSFFCKSMLQTRFYNKWHLKQVVLIWHFVQKLSLRWLQLKVEHDRRELPDVGFQGRGRSRSCMTEQMSALYYPVLFELWWKVKFSDRFVFFFQPKRSR